MRYKCIVGFYAPNKKGQRKRKITVGSLWDTVDSLSFGRPTKTDSTRLRRAWKNNSSLRLDDLVVSVERLNSCFRQVEVTIKSEKWMHKQDVDDSKND